MKDSEPYFRLGLIGWPLKYSLSPAIHQAGLQALGLNGEYRLYPIPPLPEGNTALKVHFDKIRACQLDGLNVTIPHKQSVLPLLDALTPLAQATGAVNTIFRQGEQMLGDNTDVPGFLTDIENFIGRSIHPPKTALVLGAGGASRAVTYGLIQSGWSVTIAARKPGQAQELISSLLTGGCINPTADSISLNSQSFHDWLSEKQPGLIVNTTPVGMSPNEGSSPWPVGVGFPQGAFVYDLIYHPNETLLMRFAKAAGLRTRNGLGMLVEQAAVALEHWTSLPSPVSPMRSAVLPTDGSEKKILTG